MFPFSDDILHLSIKYKESGFECGFIKTNEYDEETNFQNYISIIAGNGNNFYAKELFDYLEESGVLNSCQKNKFLAINFSGTSQTRETRNPILDNLTELYRPREVLSDMFISNYRQKQIERFIYTVKHYSEEKTCLNYIFNGLPGTGKTQAIKAIVNSIFGDATIVLARGTMIDLKALFDFCGLFEPTLLIIDDIDLFLNERRDNFNNQLLGFFLQQLGGIEKKNHFILASTNDKTMVDKAAARPGRFDMVLDFPVIHKSKYLDLIRRETEDSAIIELFSENVCDLLNARRVSGAFIVNLVKQIVSLKKMSGSINKDDVAECLESLYKGYYTQTDDNKREVGFK